MRKWKLLLNLQRIFRAQGIYDKQIRIGGLQYAMKYIVAEKKYWNLQYLCKLRVPPHTKKQIFLSKKLHTLHECLRQLFSFPNHDKNCMTLSLKFNRGQLIRTDILYPQIQSWSQLLIQVLAFQKACEAPQKNLRKSCLS